MDVQDGRECGAWPGVERAVHGAVRGYPVQGAVQRLGVTVHGCSGSGVTLGVRAEVHSGH